MKSYITGRFADFVSFGFQYHLYIILQKLILVDTECLEQYCWLRSGALVYVMLIV